MGQANRPSPIACIYGIQLKGTNRWYVGKTSDYRRRVDAHRCNLRAGTHPSPILQNACNAHGLGAFGFAIFERIEGEGDALEAALIAAEGRHFKRFAARGRTAPYYNVLMPTQQFNLETRARMSAGGTGRRHTPETRAKIGAALRGRVRTEASKEKSRASIARRREQGLLPALPWRESRKLKSKKRQPGYVDPRKGTKRPDISERNKQMGLRPSQECIAAAHSPEARAKTSAAHKAKGTVPPRSPDQQRRGTEGMLAICREPWFGQHVSEGKKAAQAIALGEGKPDPTLKGREASLASRKGKRSCRVDGCRKLVVPGTHCPAHAGALSG